MFQICLSYSFSSFREKRPKKNVLRLVFDVEDFHVSAPLSAKSTQTATFKLSEVCILDQSPCKKCEEKSLKKEK